MLVIISPAKKLDMKTLNGVQQTEPLFRVMKRWFP